MPGLIVGYAILFLCKVEINQHLFIQSVKMASQIFQCFKDKYYSIIKT